MESKELSLDTGPNPIITYDYDSYGNLVEEIDARGNPTLTEYDTSTNTYPTKITYPQTSDMRTHIVEFGPYNYRFGKVF